MSAQSAKALLALGAGVVCIACSAIFVKIAAVPGPTSAFYRVFFATAAAVPLWLSKPDSRSSAAVTLLTCVGSVFFATELVLWQVALLITSAANATLLVNIAPLWVAFGALLFFRERLGPLFWIGLALATAGMALVVARASQHSTNAIAGDWLAVVGSVFYGGYILTTQKVRSEMGTLRFLAISTVTCSVVILPVCFVLHAPLWGFSARVWLALAALGLLSHFGGYLAISYAAGYIRATSLSVTLLAQPVITAGLAATLLSETLTWRQISGGALVLAGICFVNFRKHDTAPQPITGHLRSETQTMSSL